MKKASTAMIALAATLFAGSVHADHFQDCERPDYAKQYATMFGDKLDDGVGRADTVVRKHQKKMRMMQAALIQAGVWSQDDADIFMKNIMQGDAGQALEMQRKSTGERFEALTSAPAWKAVIGAPQATSDHGMCVHGPRILEEGELIFQTMEKVFHYMEAKVATLAREKNVALPALP